MESEGITKNKHVLQVVSVIFEPMNSIQSIFDSDPAIQIVEYGSNRTSNTEFPFTDTWEYINGHIYCRPTVTRVDSSVKPFLHYFTRDGREIVIDSLSGMFKNCPLIEYIDANDWDVSMVVDFSECFYLSHYTDSKGPVTKLTTLLINNWDVSNARIMSNMFTRCDCLVSLDLNNWNVSNCTDMKYMFSSCRKLKYIHIESWNTDSLVYANGMFSNCTSLVSVDLEDWDMSNVISLCNMFSRCNSLTHAGIGTWNTISVTTVQGLFYECTSLVSVDISKWNVSNVNYFTDMFNKCTSLTYIDVSEWNTSNALEMTEMFRDCLRLTYIPVDNWNMSRVTNIMRLFCNCCSLRYINISNWDLSGIAYIYHMADIFNGCNQLVSIGTSRLKIPSSKVKDYIFGNSPISKVVKLHVSRQ